MTARHGHSLRGKRTPEHQAWANMKQRCFNPRSQAWSYYGGRGITVCQEWRDAFDVFLSDVGARPTPEHTLERVNTNGNYQPGNVIWATRTVQQRNRRCTRTVTWNGITKPLVEWAEQLGLHPMSLEKRLARWPLIKAMSIPVTISNTKRLSLTFQGETMLASQWAHRLGINPNTLYKRLTFGWPIERALTEATHPNGKRKIA